VTDRPQGPGWYDDPQDANVQRYWDGQGWTPHRQRKPAVRQAQSTPPLPPPPPANVAPPPPPSNLPPPLPTQRPAAPRVKSGARKAAFVVAGLALLLVIAALVAGRILLGNFLPGLLLVAAIAIIAITLAVRSGQSVPRKAMTVTAIALVVAVAIPASLKVVYPTYHHFFPDSTPQASPPSLASPSGSPPSQASAPTQASPHSPASAGAAQWNIIVNGQDIRAYHPELGAGCSGQNPIHIAVSGGSSFAELTEGTLQVLRVYINDEAKTGNSYMYDPKQQASHVGGGDAQATQSGKTYKITGHIAPYHTPNETETQHDATPVPFEFDATCS
jgi:Protein of unknown function (DUF2510)/Mycobacterium 19 kDa lipoprotein antigen